MTPLLSLTQSQVMAALRSYLLDVLLPSQTEVVMAQDNRVPEPLVADFVVMTPMAQVRLATNETDYADNIVTGTVSGSVLTVSSVTRESLTAGQVIADTGNVLQPGTVISSQISGAPGGIGTYYISPDNQFYPPILLDDRGNRLLDDAGNLLFSAGAAPIYAGLRSDTTPVEFRVQLDVHGPMSADNTRVLETLFRSDFGVDFFTANGLAIAPLYCSEPHQIPFINAEQAYENRWVLDVSMQVNSAIGTWQQFADQLIVRPVEAEARLPQVPSYLLDDAGRVLMDEQGDMVNRG